MIQTVDNYFPFAKCSDNYYFKFVNQISKIKKDKKVIGNKIDITLESYHSKSENNTFFSFLKDDDKIKLKNEDDLIISIVKDNDENYQAKTGNYVGRFTWDGLKVDIKSRFSDKFLKRMLNFANGK
jgi:hypothetical protein